jgi:hypothetical protein
MSERFSLIVGDRDIPDHVTRIAAAIAAMRECRLMESNA